MIFHSLFEARTSVCPQMCVYISGPRHGFFFLSRVVDNFAFYPGVSSLSPVRACFMFYHNRPIFVKQEFLIDIRCAGLDKVFLAKRILILDNSRSMSNFLFPCEKIARHFPGPPIGISS